MAIPAKFRLIHSDLNRFLLAAIGEEENGMPLTVMSACTRLGVDPWQEGTRLSSLPENSAAQALAGLIAKLPPGRWQSSEIEAIAARLVTLLPKRAAAPARRKRPRIRGRAVLWVICVVLGAAVLVRLPAVLQPAAVPPPPYGQAESLRH